MRTNVTNTQEYHFYRPNGWCGKNYDSRLTGKDIAAKVREYVKKNFPEFKFSIRSKSKEIYITLLSGPVPALMEGNQNEYESCMDGFGAYYKDKIIPEVLKMMDDVYSYVKTFMFSDSDAMTNYRWKDKGHICICASTIR